MSAIACGFCLISLLVYVFAVAVLTPPRSWREVPVFAAQIIGGVLILLFMCFVVIP